MTYECFIVFAFVYSVDMERLEQYTRKKALSEQTLYVLTGVSTSGRVRLASVWCISAACILQHCFPPQDEEVLCLRSSTSCWSGVIGITTLQRSTSLLETARSA